MISSGKRSRSRSSEILLFLTVTFRAGIDGGGVFKEFLTSLAKEVFDSDRGLWLSTEQNELYPNPHNYAKDCMLLPFIRTIFRSRNVL